MSDDIIFFLDESGSTGTNFLDSQQPYFVQGGIALKRTNEKQAIDCFLKWENTYRQHNQAEIKGSGLFKRVDGIRIFEDLMTNINKYILSPTYSFLDKKYGLCFTSVEAFLDSGYNQSTQTEFFYGDNRIDWAEIFYKNYRVQYCRKLRYC